MRPTLTDARGLSEAARAPDRASHSVRWRVLICLLGGVCIATGCSLAKHETVATESMLHSLAGKAGEDTKTNAVAALQGEVMREADQYVGAIAQATDDFRKQVGTAEARDAAQQWKLNEATAAYVNATDENPVLGAVGMVVLASLSRMVVEDYWVGERFGQPARPLLERHSQLETNAWSLARRVLTPDQQQELHNLILESRQKNPHLRYVSAVRLPELVTTLGEGPSQEQIHKPGSLFGLLYINPLAGLDPTTQAIQQTRMLAQRMMYYAQRAPTLLSWQVELTTYQLAAQPEARQLLSDVNDVGKSTKVFAKTAEDLPKLVNDQREAAINQLLAGVTTAGSNLLVSLAAEEMKVRDLLGETRQTLNAGGDMANSVKGAIQSLDAFMHYVSPPDTNPPPPSTNSQPFNILDYGKAAGQIGAMAKDLNTLLNSADQSLPQASRLGQQAEQNAKQVVNYAFRLGLVLIVALGIVSVLVVWTCRQLDRRAAAHTNENRNLP